MKTFKVIIGQQPTTTPSAIIALALYKKAYLEGRQPSILMGTVGQGDWQQQSTREINECLEKYEDLIDDVIIKNSGTPSAGISDTIPV